MGSADMDFIRNKRGSGQAFKLAAAALVAASVFLLLVSLADEATDMQETVDDLGAHILDANQNVSKEILKHETK